MLKKYTFIFDDDNETKTLLNDYTGFVTQLIIYNDNPQTNNYNLYIDGDIKLLNKSIDSKETQIIKLDLLLNNETLKMYSQLKDLNVAIQVLVN